MRATTLIRYLIVTVLALSYVPGVRAAESTPPAVETTSIVEVPPGQGKPVVQIAILLDTSGSMSGLIDQARTELWSIVNEFIFAEQNGRAPEVQVALYEYGKSSLSRESGWIRQIVPLTTDLDKISEELFALRTNGGSEYCGWVIREATQKLAWSELPNDLKVIFIAGNEPFTQGPVDYREACKAAVTRGVIVNTIHCGGEQQGIDGKWKDGAVLADGRHLNIDHNRQVVHIAAPQDQEIADLGLKLNQTYIPYGREGRALQERQAAQDENAMQASPAAPVQRAVTKSSANYRNTGWDLVDAVRANQVDLDQARKEDLPQNMREMSPEQRAAYVEAKAKDRTEIQTRIQQLNAQRNEYIAQETQKRQQQGETLGSAVKQAIRAQAAGKNYTFKPAPTSADTSGATPQQ